ncbi:MAG: hypothetical protein WBM52_16115, partial [Thiogranum sp.]
LSRTLDSRHILTGPSAARAQGWAKVEQCRSNCREMLPSSVQGGIHKVNRRQAREGALGYSVFRKLMSAN